jgi:hypothetical protein
LTNTAHVIEQEQESGPWNPGIESPLPAKYLPLSTVFRPENVISDLPGIQELSGFSGLPLHDIAEFRPERLAMHELIIRVTADVSVPDGTRREDLGTNFRKIAGAILFKYVDPRMDEVREIHASLRRQISDLLAQELDACFCLPPLHSVPSRKRRGPFARFRFRFRSRPARHAVHSECPEERDQRAMSAWTQKAAAAETGLERSVYRALVRVASSVSQKHGRLIGGPGLLAELALPLACNDYGSEVIGWHIEQYIHRAVSEEGYTLVPAQERPVVMKVKGASASGKSTMRPMQKQLAEKLGIRWDEFALIDPDVWRKFLLDYSSLGAARKYGGMLTSHEVAIADKKLDRYLVHKAEAGRMSHLHIDRFRFDSFIPCPAKDGSGVLPAKFGHQVYMFFMVTPPEATVERAWKRGERSGRYKAVDDILYHNIEAYTGMPRLFLSWAGEQEKQIHFEFLDNGVPEGCRPRTIAFGTSCEMNILDIERLLDIDRFKKINLDARQPGDLYHPDSQAPGKNTEFLRECARKIPAINFVDRKSGRVYAKVRGGKLTRDEPELCDPEANAGLDAVAEELSRGFPGHPHAPGARTTVQGQTLGAWGSAEAPDSWALEPTE